MSTREQLLAAVQTYVAEDTKFESGNASAGTRARKALQEITKLCKTRRNEITIEKAARKEAK